jgi:hypothetical protein
MPDGFGFVFNEADQLLRLVIIGSTGFVAGYGP